MAKKIFETLKEHHISLRGTGEFQEEAITQGGVVSVQI